VTTRYLVKLLLFSYIVVKMQCQASKLLLLSNMLVVVIQRLWADNDTLVYSLQEELPANTFVGEIGKDYAVQSRYSARQVRVLHFDFTTWSHDYFVINHRTGEILTKKPIDREEICFRMESCSISANVILKPLNVFRQIVKVRVEIVDVNDNDPVLHPSTVNFSISEMAQMAAELLVGHVYDSDTTQFGVQRYRLEPRSGKFQLDVCDRLDSGKDLKLVLVEKLDYEDLTSYNLTVYVIDGGGRSGSVIVNIEVEDANDNRPEFDNVTLSVTVEENTTVGDVITWVHATDKDSGLNGEVRYSLSNSTLTMDDDVFGINSQTGEVFLEEALDYERQTIYVLFVTASDRGQDSQIAQATIIVNIQDVNDNPPSIAVNGFTASDDYLYIEIPEDSEPGSFVFHFSVRDLDSGENGGFFCFITRSQFLLLEMYPGEYKAVTVVRLGREIQEFYDLVITCRDYGDPSLVSSTALKVRVTGADNDLPDFEKDHLFFALTENNEVGTEIARISLTHTTKRFNRKILFELDEAVQNLLEIDSYSGILTTKVRFDHEEFNLLEFNVRARDRDIRTHSTHVQVTLSILDEDDEIPQFTSERYVFRVLENQEVGTKIGHVTAIDRDSPPLDLLFYSVQPVDENSIFFQIDIFTGQLLTRAVLDRESQSVFNITVLATSHDRNQSSSAKITIYVDDLNDNNPVFIFPSENNNTVVVPGSSGIGQIVAKLSANDRDDVGVNSDLIFRVVSGNGSSTFSVNPTAGDVSLTKRLNDSHSLYVLDLVVVDRGQPQLSGSARLNIVTEDSWLIKSRQADWRSFGSGLLHSRQLLNVLFATFLFLLGLIALASVMILRQCQNRV